MMLQQSNFYTLLSQEKNETETRHKIVINPEHQIFSGHFPGQPVVPGVCMVQIIKELTETQTQQSLLLRAAAQIKFLQLLLPQANQPIIVTINIKSSDSGYTVNASFVREEQAVMKFSGHFTTQS